MTDNNSSPAKKERIILEICAYGVGAAIAAQEGGADRVELCDNAPEGGTTPSYATIELAKKYLQIPVYPIIRPRGGDFLYDEIEFETMQKDIAVCKQLGCEGVVIGILTADGKVDKIRCKKLIALAWPMGVTFHRAFDMAADPFEALEDIIETGCERILSSGQHHSAPEGAELLARLIVRADERVTIMPGGGVRENNIATLLEKTGAREFHTSAKITAPGKMKFKNPRATMGGEGNEYDISTVSAQLVKTIRKNAEEALRK
ncbi:MAG TPA: copper homeostasis protein CutC [Chitinophagaceae bacterium]